MFSEPQKNIEQFDIQPGMRVADLGSGSGHYTLAASKVVGDMGRVYSIDIQKDLLAKIKNEAGKLHLFNVEIIWGDIEKIGGTRIRDKSIDCAIASNILFQVPNKDIFCKEVKRIIKPKGRILVIDWAESFGGLGPQPGDVFSYQMSKDLFEKNGFLFEKNIMAGAHHYGVIFKSM